MFNRKELKERAKLVLFRSYSKVFLACFLVNILSGGGIGFSARKLQDVDILSMPPQKIFAIFVIIVSLAVIGIALSIFAIQPLQVGLKKFMTENAKSDAQLDLLLTPFGEDYKNIVLAQFMKNLFIFLWSIPAYLPTVVLLIFSDKITPMIEGVYAGSVAATAATIGVAVLWVVFTLLFSVPFIIKELQYSMVSYILADNPATEWKSALSNSKEMMVGNKWEYVKLMLSFVPWYLAANLLCCIGGFLVMPYVEATVCEMYLELSGKTPVNAEYEY
ncbi:MAG: DUF975 family protein [Clostridia bacterium]|nr:DUF975 family protein [Clostridia bacterium]